MSVNLEHIFFKRPAAQSRPPQNSVTERRKYRRQRSGIFAKLVNVTMTDSGNIVPVGPPRPRAQAIKRSAAFVIHVFTALGAGFALIALFDAVREH